MLGTLAQHWWVVLLRGIAAILFGFMAYAWPGVTIAVLVLIWGAYALVDGVFEVVAGVRAKYGSLILLGVLGIAAGVVTFFWPGITAIALLYIIAFWAIVAGVLQISAAFRRCARRSRVSGSGSCRDCAPSSSAACSSRGPAPGRSLSPGSSAPSRSRGGSCWSCSPSS